MYTSRLIAGIVVMDTAHTLGARAKQIEHCYKYNKLPSCRLAKNVWLVNLQGLPHLGAYSNHYYLPGLGM